MAAIRVAACLPPSAVARTVSTVLTCFTDAIPTFGFRKCDWCAPAESLGGTFGLRTQPTIITFRVTRASQSRVQSRENRSLRSRGSLRCRRFCCWIARGLRRHCWFQRISLGRSIGFRWNGRQSWYHRWFYRRTQRHGWLRCGRLRRPRGFGWRAGRSINWCARWVRRDRWYE